MNTVFAIKTSWSGIVANFALMLKNKGEFVYDIAFLKDEGRKCVGHNRIVLDHMIESEEEARSLLA